MTWTPPRTRALLAGLLGALALGGCASGSDDCDQLCAAARPAFEGCLVEWGLDYGEAVRYEDADDYDSWCATWVFEQRTLADTATEPEAAHEALIEGCQQRITALNDGACADYWGLW